MKVSEIFSSIQGSGPFAGRQVVFLRTSGCDLCCSFCDSSFSWVGGREMTTQEIIKELHENGLDQVQNLVLTGGEPLLYSTKLTELLRWYPPTLVVHVETNGTHFVDFSISTPNMNRECHYIVSPKLGNSGNSPEKAKVHPDWIIMCKNGGPVHFKFVVGNVDDMDEVNDWVQEHGIPKDRVWIMPECTTKEGHATIFPKVFDWCREFGYNVTARLHIMAHGNKRGV